MEDDSDTLVLEAEPDSFEAGEPRVEHHDAIRSLHEVLLRYPLASRAAFAALVREGRVYAETAEGQELLRALSRSTKAARLRVIWEILSMSGLEDESAGILPSVFIDKLARSLAMERIEPVLAELFERRI